MGCQQSTPLSPKHPANLIEPCPDLQNIEEGSGEAVLFWAIDAASKYEECKTRHRRLAETLK